MKKLITIFHQTSTADFFRFNPIFHETLFRPTSIDVSEIDLEGYFSTRTDGSPDEERQKILGLYDISTDVDNKVCHFYSELFPRKTFVDYVSYH